MDLSKQRFQEIKVRPDVKTVSDSEIKGLKFNGLTELPDCVGEVVSSLRYTIAFKLRFGVPGFDVSLQSATVWIPMTNVRSVK